MTPWVRKQPAYTGSREALIDAASSLRPDHSASAMSLSRSPTR